MKTFILLLAMMVAVPSMVFATKIKDIDVSPKNPKVGDTIKISVKTSGDVARAVIEFPDLNIEKDLSVIGKNAWGIAIPLNNPGEKKFKVLLYQKKNDKKAKDTEKDKFVVSAKNNAAKSKLTPVADKQAPVPVVQLAQQQYGSVSGKVHKNTSSGPALSGVSVNCGGKSATTDGNGNFKITGVQVGNHDITFTKSGYDDFKNDVFVKAGANISAGDRWLTEKITVPAPSRGPTGNFRPNLSNPAYSAAGGNPFAKAGYGGQCTAFAWGRALEISGNKLDTTSNAKEWFKSTRLPKGNSPKQHSIAVWGGDAKNTHGHVAFVEDVDSKGNLTINEANFRKYNSSNFGGGYDGSPLSLSPQQAVYRSGAGNLLGYIYTK